MSNTPRTTPQELPENLLKEFDGLVPFSDRVPSYVELGIAKYMATKAYNAGLHQAQLEADKRVEEERERIIKYLEDVESTKWSDAEHCTCLGYAIWHLQHPEDDGMVYASKSLKKETTTERGGV